MSTLLTTADFVTAVALAPFAPAGVTYAAVSYVPGSNGIPATASASPDAFSILRTQNSVTTTRWPKVYWRSGIGYGPNDANPNGSSVEIHGFGGDKAVSDAAEFLKTLI